MHAMVSRRLLARTTLHLVHHPLPNLCIFNAMAAIKQCTHSRSALNTVFRTTSTQSVILPRFLVPAIAFPSPTPRTHFSTTTRCQSKIGKAPLSLPPEVSFQILEPSAGRQRRNMSRTEPPRTVEIQGPLGKMSMTVPPYINITSDEESRTHSLSISDTEDKKQKAMWGA